ncbi:IS66 family transposase [soil metagenome]
MEQFFEKIPSTKAASWSHGELLERYSTIEAELLRALRENYQLRNLKISDEQLKMFLEEQVASLKEAEFGASSERYKKPEKSEKPQTPPKPRVKKPSERYPNLPIREQEIAATVAPLCSCCGEKMTDSGMREESEQLTVIPKKYEILRQCRVKYRCKCHGSIVTAPAPPRIIEGSSYSDEMIVDVVLSKYCDLIPIERYVAMAGRGGLKDLPPQSLIEVTHGFADFVAPVYSLICQGVLDARVVHADETPHRMLEGSDKKSWYLWGFSTMEHCFLECHDTRSGDVASDVLLHSHCEVLVSDVYSGYGKAVRIANEQRRKTGMPIIRNAYCNAHARRYFRKTWPKYQEAAFYLDYFHEIYRLEEAAKGQAPPKILELRAQMAPRFAAMKKKALEELPGYPELGKYSKALTYFLKNFEGLTLFLGDAGVPIDNNSQERLLRNHVVGRKTWYGTHSERGAFTAAILFTIVETCKLNGVNPREYIKALVQELLAGKPPKTPSQFKAATPTH